MDDNSKRLVEDEDRPMCSCGSKMELIDFRGYYEEFKYWECGVCLEPTHLESDEIVRGSYG